MPKLGHRKRSMQNISHVPFESVRIPLNGSIERADDEGSVSELDSALPPRFQL